jgi:hypothetical protein
MIDIRYGSLCAAAAAAAAAATAALLLLLLLLLRMLLLRLLQSALLGTHNLEVCIYPCTHALELFTSIGAAAFASSATLLPLCAAVEQ